MQFETQRAFIDHISTLDAESQVKLIRTLRHHQWTENTPANIEWFERSADLVRATGRYLYGPQFVNAWKAQEVVE